MPALLTTVPDVLVALTALGQTSLGAAFAVVDGTPDVDNLPGEFLAVGFSRDEDQAGVDGQLVDDGNRISSETYTVHCVLSVATGDTDAGSVAARRARAATLFSAFGIALRSDPQLGGALTAAAGRADISSTAWIYGPSLDGTYAEVAFDINVAAYYLGAT